MPVSPSYSCALFSVLFAGVTILLSCSADKVEKTTNQGYIEVTGGKIWYEVTGSSKNEIPIILLHGGPGYPSYYLKPFNQLSDSRRVIRFDQLGSGKSDRIVDTTLMTVEHHVQQIRNLLTSLDIDTFYLYGHSWGSMLAIEYYLKHPEGVKAMILAGPCLSAARWMSDADSLIASLPDTTQKALNDSKLNVVKDSAKLLAAIDHYYDKFYCINPTADVDSADQGFGVSIYRYMWGNSEFFASGTLKGYDRTGALSSIKIPVLFTAGEFDEVRIPTLKFYHSLVPNAHMKVIGNAGHLSMQDNPEEDVAAVRVFLSQLER